MSSDICLDNAEKPCGSKIADNENAIECEVCGIWHHAGCQNLSSPAFKAIQKYKLFWLCDRCKLKCLSIITLNPMQEPILTRLDLLEAKIDSKMSELESICKNTCESQNNICKSYADFTKNIAELGIKSTTANETINQKSTKLLVKEIINEYESGNREQNVIVYNCEESQDALNDFIKIIKEGCEIQIKRNDIEKANRIGRKDDSNQSNKPRPLLVCLKSVELKKKS